MTLITHQLVNGEDAKAVIILDGDGNQITSFGGGTQYTEGATDTTITGTAILWEDASDTLRPVSSAKPLPVEIIAGAGSGGTAAADDADFTAGTTSGTPAMGVYESTPTSVTDGDLGTVGITQGRRMKTSATIDAALPAGTNNIGDVDVLSSALPTGAATSANQTTAITHLSEIEGAVETVETTVATIGTTPLVRMAIFDDSNTQITSFGGGTQYTEDAAAAANPVGTALIGVRADALAGVTSADGDNVAARMTDKGELYVKHADSVAVTGTFFQATQPVSGTVTAELSATDNAVLDNIDADLTTIIGHVDGLETLIGTTNTTLGTIDTDTGNIATAVQLIDNAIHVDDAAFTLGTSSGVMMMGFAGTQSVNANDAGAIAMETDGAIHIHDGGNTITVDGTVAVTGVSTLAEQQSQTTHLATIAGDTTSIQTAVELIDDAVATLGTTTYSETSTKGLTIGAVRRDADTTLVDTTNEIGPLQMNAAGQLKVEVFSGETLPVSGTVTAELSATDNAVLDNIDADLTTIIGHVDGLETLIGTTNTTLGTIDTDTGNIVTAVQLLDDAVYADDADWTDDTSKHLLVGGLYQSTPQTITDGDVAPFNMTSTGAMHVHIASGSSSGTEYNENDATPATPAGGTIMIERDDALSTPVAEGDWMGLKGDANGALYVTLATGLDSTNDSVSAAQSGTWTVGLSAGTNGIGKLTANSGVDIGDVDVTSVIAGTGATNLGKAEDAAHSTGDTLVGVATRRIDTAASSSGTSGDYSTLDTSAEGAVWGTLTPTTTSGCTIFRSLDLDESEEEIKATAGNVYGYFVFNAAATTHYLKFYNATAANVTVGTTTPVLTFPIPAGAAANVGFPYPVSFGTAITAAVTTGVADADTGAPAANACVVNIFYK